MKQLRLTAEEFLIKNMSDHFHNGFPGTTTPVASIMQAYADHCEESAWVSVDERLPEIGQKVIVIRGRDIDRWFKAMPPIPSVYDGKFQVYKDVCVGDRCLVSYYGEITHWRPLPSPPSKISANETEKTT